MALQSPLGNGWLVQGTQVAGVAAAAAVAAGDEGGDIHLLARPGPDGVSLVKRRVLDRRPLYHLSAGQRARLPLGLRGAVVVIGVPAARRHDQDEDRGDDGDDDDHPAAAATFRLLLLRAAVVDCTICRC